MNFKLHLPVKIKLLMIGLFYFLSSGSLVFGATTPIRTVGYLPDYDYGYMNATVNLDQFTDLNYFSLIPQRDGSLKFTDSGSGPLLEELVTKAHGADVRVGISIGGWGMSDNFAEATNEKNLANFVQEIVTFVQKYNLDTVDIDWEYPEVNQAKQFTNFIKALRAALKPDTFLTICVPTGVASNGQETGKWGEHFPPEALKTADWINIMSYDAQVEGSVHHSPVDLQKNSLNYWNEVMGGDQIDKLVGGVPFYGKSEAGAVMTYGRILEEYGRVLVADHVKIKDQEYYFNNKETIEKKVEDTVQLGALGVMIWAPTQDAAIKSSSRLMDVVTETIKKSERNLDKTVFETNEEKPKREVPWNFFLLLVSVTLLGLGTLFFLGRLNNFLPEELFGKQVNAPGLGRLLGFFIGFIAILIAVSIVIPIYYIVGAIVLIIAGLVYILKK